MTEENAPAEDQPQAAPPEPRADPPVIAHPPPYTPRDWYWRAEDGRIFASARSALVPIDDVDLAAFLARGGTCTTWPRDDSGAQTTASLQEVLGSYSIFADLAAYAASARYAKETGGIIVNWVKLATDRESQALITGAWATAQINPQVTIQWKGSDGTFTALNAASITAVASAVTAHVQACFAAEAQVDAAITAGTITTMAEVDAAFAAVTV